MSGKYFIVGICVLNIFLLVCIFQVYAQETQLEYDQNLAQKLTGDYFSDVSNPQFTINTYETLCTGYYTMEETETEIIYTGYGDLKEEYTKTISKEIKNSTSSPDIVIDSIATTSEISIPI